MTIQQEIAPCPHVEAADDDRVAAAARFNSKPRVGDWVEVRTRAEILATLDKTGELDNLPFMPEMLRFCGRRFRVHRRAHKTCDTASGYATGKWLSVKLDRVVHLDLRCDGSAHGGCQAACLLFWKEAWLKPVDAGSTRDDPHDALRYRRGCTEADLLRAAGPCDQNEAQRYTCQATRVPRFSKPLRWWDMRQYVEDYTSGNASLRKLLHAVAYGAYRGLTLAERRTLGKPGRWLYDRFQSIRGGIPFPARKGKLPVGQATAREDLGLRPGEWVRVKPFETILSTLDTVGGNRNMNFADEMAPYCGGVYRVRSRVERFIDETNGQMRTMKTPAVILEDVVCQGCYSRHRMLCQRHIYPWWREIWLERVSP